MPTGRRFLKITNKRILGFRDLDERFLTYLREAHLESVRARWDVDGAFNTKLGFSGLGTPDVFTVIRTSTATDGLGHIMDITEVPSEHLDVQFENAIGITYYVGLTYCEVPRELHTNPRNGRPEYSDMEEYIGVVAAPTSVTDNRNGTITLNINSATESGVDHSGREVLVWMVRPESSAQATAIETATSVYSAPNNTITTVGALGQTSVSTDPSKYRVAVLGPTVRRNTNLETDPNTMFLGTIIGTGAGNVPGSGNVTNQRLLKTFQDASQVTFQPYGWLGTTTVQSALQEVVDDLAATADGASGALLVGVEAPDFQPVAWQTNTSLGGGIGNIADGTFVSQEVMSALRHCDAAIRRRRGWTATYGLTGDERNVADIVALVLTVIQTGAMATGGTYWLQRVSDHDPGDVGYTITNNQYNGAPYILGEESDVGTNPLIKTPITKDTAAANISDFGHWQRVYFRTSSAARIRIGGDSGANFIAEDFGVKSGSMVFIDNANAGMSQPFHLRNGVVKPETGQTTSASAAALEFLGGNNDDEFHGTIENMVILSPGASQSSPAPVAALHFASCSATEDGSRPLVFRNCVIICLRDVPAVLISDNQYSHKIVFENCMFFGANGAESYTIDVGTGSDVVFKNCVVYSGGGNGISIRESKGEVDGVAVLTGTSTTVTNPQLIRMTGPASGGALQVRNMRAILNAAAVRSTGTASQPVVEIGSYNSGTFGGFNVVSVDGLYVQYGSASALHRAETVLLWSSSGDHCCNYYNVVVNLAGKAPAELGAKQSNFNAHPIVGLQGRATTRLKVFGLTVRNGAHPSGNLAKSLIIAKNAEIHGLHAHMGTTGSAAIRTMLDLEGEASVIGGELFCSGLKATSGFIRFSGVDNLVHALHMDDCDLSTDSGAAGSVGYVNFNNIGPNALVSCHFQDLSIANYSVIEGVNKSCRVTDCMIRTSGGGQPVIDIVAGARRFAVRGCEIWWDATSVVAINTAGPDNMISNNILLQTAGASAGIATSGGGSIAVDNILTNTP